MSSLRVEKIDCISRLEALAPEWAELERRIRPRTPFTSPLWNLLWWKHFRARGALVRDELFAHAVRSPDGELLAVAPLMVTHRPAVGPIRLRQLQFFGADANLTEVRGLVSSRIDQDEMIATLVRHLGQRARHWDWLEWSGIDGGSSASGNDPEARAQEGIPLYYLSLPGRWEQFKSSLPRNTKEALRKCYNSLRRAGHGWTFEVVQEPGEVPAALSTFFRLHRARAVAPGMVAHPDVFSTWTARRFFTDYVTEMAALGKLSIFQVRVDGQTVATRVGFLLGDELYLYYSGYDTRWSRFSVMTTVVAEAIRWAIEKGLRVVNLSTGQDVGKLRWRPAVTMFGQVVIPAPSVRGVLALGAYDWVSRGIRSSSLRAGLLTLLGRSR
jgi:CelD/BcsL family acetyltransferase involved in cellulose biosynthesis